MFALFVESNALSRHPSIYLTIHLSVLRLNIESIQKPYLHLCADSTHIYIYIYVCVHCSYTYIYIYMYRQKNMHIYIYVYNVYTCACVHMHMYACISGKKGPLPERGPFTLQGLSLFHFTVCAIEQSLVL